MSILSDIGAIVGAIAPSMASALGGPLAGTAMSAITSALGLTPDEDASPEALLTRLQGATPTDLLALKEADRRFAIEMQRIGVDLERIAAAEKGSARNREIAVKDRVPMVLGMLITFGFFGLIAALVTHEVPAANKDVINILTGVLGSAFSGGVVGYYFGMSNTKKI